VAELQAAVSTGYSRGKFEGLLDQPVSVLARLRPLKTISVAIADFETSELFTTRGVTSILRSLA
jgi:hypothetical protein